MSKVSDRLISTLWASKTPTKWYYHYCLVCSSMPKVLKVIGLQYRYNISKKEVRKGVHFLHADEHQCFYKLVLLFLMDVGRYVQSTQNRKLVIFFKDCCSYFCFLLWFRYFTGVQPCLLLLFSSHSQTRNFLSERLNLNRLNSNYEGRGSHLFCLCSKLMFFNRSSNSFMPIKQAKKSLYQALWYT